MGKLGCKSIKCLRGKRGPGRRELGYLRRDKRCAPAKLRCRARSDRERKYMSKTDR